MMEKKENNCASCAETLTRKFKFCPACGEKSAAVETAPGPAAYRLTIVAARNVRQRNLLLLAAALLLMSGATGGLIYSIFNKTFELDAVAANDLTAFIEDVDPVSLDPAEELRKNRKKDGGGGGGRNDPNPVQKGREATQTDQPLFSPSKDYVRMTDPELKIRAATDGTKQAPVTDEPYGLKRGGEIPSDGEGCCGGQGRSNIGRGQGDDPGDGLGPGRKRGSGNDGEDSDGGPTDDPIEKLKVRTGGVTKPLNILSKPRAGYTDAARENFTQGKVVLKVTFLASGEIGAITVVTGLPNGLTERAIASARAIRFEPARSNGVAVSVTKTIEYTFAIF